MIALDAGDIERWTDKENQENNITTPRLVFSTGAAQPKQREERTTVETRQLQG